MIIFSLEKVRISFQRKITIGVTFRGFRGLFVIRSHGILSYGHRTYRGFLEYLC